MKLLTELREALIERILRKRLQERYDSGFLAGIDTALDAVYLSRRSGPRQTPVTAIQQAREGYLEEIESR
jgi:hypothetical protein